MSRLIVAAHQADLLPYSGFFYKMAKADIFEVKLWDQYLAKGYQRRVKMRDAWANVQLVDGAGSYAAIVEKRIDPDKTAYQLARLIEGRYGGSRYWKTRGPSIVSKIEDIHTDRLWQFNFELILIVRDILGIDTPLSIGLPAECKGVSGLVSSIRKYRGDVTYLSGTGARGYMGDCSEFTDAGIDVVWSKHKMVTGDSILSVIMDYENPLEVVLLEECSE